LSCRRISEACNISGRETGHLRNKLWIASITLHIPGNFDFFFGFTLCYVPPQYRSPDRVKTADGLHLMLAIFRPDLLIPVLYRTGSFFQEGKAPSRRKDITQKSKVDLIFPPTNPARNHLYPQKPPQAILRTPSARGIKPLPTPRAFNRSDPRRPNFTSSPSFKTKREISPKNRKERGIGQHPPTTLSLLLFFR